MKKVLIWSVAFLYFITLMLSTSNVSAHTDNSEGYSKIKSVKDKLLVELQIDYFELGRLIDFGVKPGASEAELEMSLEKNIRNLEAYLSSHLGVFTNGAKTEGKIIETDIVRKVSRDYAKITMEFPESALKSSLQIQYSIFFDDNDPLHRNIVSYDINNKQGQFIFNAGDQELNIGKETIYGQIIRFVELGFHHIMIGYDHILFVIALVLGTRRISDVIKVISVFTIAHSITLGLTALKLVHFPGEIVEPLIALSIAFVAVENYFGFSSKYRLAVVFGFGLIHGVGFAGALQLSANVTWRSLLSIFSFNIGVEGGQALIILLMFPLLYYMGRFNWSTLVRGAVTAGIFGMGIVWYFQRFLA
ncbi:hydrogenase/urease accessory protein HupE [Peribacillus deserti]|uniref:Hydrogenase/urease accessory protein HupE n=1 Tax=Peribacillus deserti TaxID=673318 RepID=A0ABS2QKQ1_9BACI|nr:HupE/UreJ family protein [Peribacillus deserti]MBM7693741.1 hydrogenase/urease accessory protein HupE [Peribacillus deserti]